MSLKEYVKKRNFKKTSEPKSGKSKDKDHLIFVVQKHDATRLHYDFRLEMDGVLKSWAVPKGPMLGRYRFFRQTSKGYDGAIQSAHYR